MSNSVGWMTTHASKERMLAYFKDYFERGLMGVYSMDTLEEMKAIVRDEGGIGAYGRGKDDRVIATGLACAAYAEQLQPRLLMQRVTRKVSEQQAAITAETASGQRVVSTYLKRIGMYGK
jgi:hypothetical protein